MAYVLPRAGHNMVAATASKATGPAKRQDSVVMTPTEDNAHPMANASTKRPQTIRCRVQEAVESCESMVSHGRAPGMMLAEFAEGKLRRIPVPSR